MLFSNRLRSIRNAKNLSQKEFAALLDINAVTLSHYENGKREPDLDRFATLCQRLSVSADYLLGLTDTPATAASVPVSITPVSVPRSVPDPFEDLTPEQRSAIELSLKAFRDANAAKAKEA